MTESRDPVTGEEIPSEAGTHPTGETGDMPGLLDDVPPSGDITPGDAATRAEGPGIRQDPDDAPWVVDQDGAVVDTGSPQDYGEPNDDLEAPRS